MQVVPERILGVFGGEDFRVTYPNGDCVEHTVVLLRCRVVSGDLNSLDGEAVRLDCVNASEMPNLGLPYPSRIFSDDGDGTVPIFPGERRVAERVAAR